MSTTYSIACHDCKKQLWIAQSSFGKGFVYASPKALDALYDFLNDHLRHRLTYDENCGSEIAEYEDVETTDATPQDSAKNN